ncbi:aromatic ring-hydroxylating dioxygenase subunit alpha [Erythrobacteraceae bacterium E2-1 Yellow Sea]|nr:aromatic ring-hydroxylating dioxygenase subunit alpha [Erythrobacteraceae bacterium E2-1 Yellow Sea]
MNLIQQVKDITSEGLETAHSLPFGAYSDAEFYNLEMEKIFKDDWVFVCNEGEVSQHGDYYAFTLANEPVVVIRGKDNELRAMSNVCRHRGTPLNDEGFGNAKRMVCPYHAWTYTDSGKLLGVPHPGTIDIKKEEHCLPHFKLESWHGLVFINLNNNAAPLAERYAGMDKYLKRYNLNKFVHGQGGEDEEWQTNWKLAIENGIESYHLFKVHQKTLEPTLPTKHAFYIEGGSEWTLTGGDVTNTGVGPMTSAVLNAITPEKTKRLWNHYVVISLPPNFAGLLIGDTLGYIAVRPGTAGKSYIRAGSISSSRVIGDMFGYIRAGSISSSRGSESALDLESGFTQAFLAEDKWICERNQRSMNSKVGKPGKLVELERVVVDFYHYLNSRLFDQGPTANYVAPDSEKLVD